MSCRSRGCVVYDMGSEAPHDRYNNNAKHRRMVSFLDDKLKMSQCNINGYIKQKMSWR